jgi:hypothetical protein
MHTKEMERTLMHAFEQTWDRVYTAFRRQYRGPAAELAAEEAYRRLAIKLKSNSIQTNAPAVVRVGDLLEDIVTDMLTPTSTSDDGTTNTATMSQRA